ncbi:MAG: bifunctional folylpolyglutamate synthase/dihydrofolate synthase, partial [Paracoccaceae bacterium]
PAAGVALAEALSRLPARPLHLVCGMLNTKDVTGYLRPLADIAQSLQAVSIPGADATLPAGETAAAAVSVGIAAGIAPSLRNAVAGIAANTPNARILICGSLYLAGDVLTQNG